MTGKPVVLITGASSGIGEAAARYFAARGWAVVLAARSTDKLARIAAEIEEAGGTALAITVDVTAPADRARLVAQADAAFGRVDALVNNAGRGMSGTFATLSLDDLDYIFDLNVLAPVAMLQAVVPLMQRQGGGVVVNVSSLAETLPIPYMGGYGASKAALGYITDAAAVELNRDRIAVVKVMPGLVTSDFDRNVLASGSSLSLEQLLAKANFITAMPPERVAGAIWKAVQTRRSLRCLSPLDHVFSLVARHAPNLVHALFKAAVLRYIGPGGKPSDADIRGDVKHAGWAAGGVLALGALVATGLSIWLRDRRAIRRK